MLRAQRPGAQGGGAADKKAGRRGNAILPTRAPGRFKRLLGSALTSSGADRARRELQPHFLTAADMAEPARPRSAASITGMNSKSALSQRKRGSATAGIFEASSKFTTI